MAVKDSRTKEQLKAIFKEMLGNPYHRFNVSFAVMFLLPLLALVYILASELFTLDILTGRVGAILFLAIIIALSGYLFGYKIIKDIFSRVIYYAARAKRSDEAKAGLIASVAHEMKNPLYTIRWCLFSITESLAPKLGKEQKDNVVTCNKTIDRMSRLVDGLLDLYKIEAGMIKLNRKKINPIKLINTQLKEFRSSINQKKIKIITDFKEKNLFIWGDSDKISRAINNLLSNAIKYTHVGGIIVIRLYEHQDFLRLDFEDNGRGIPNDKLNKIFDKFQRLDKTQEGTGLGLAITKDIVELHQGKILAQSTLGKGSCFSVILPLSLRN